MCALFMNLPSDIKLGDRVRVKATKNTVRDRIAGQKGLVTAIVNVSAAVHLDGDDKPVSVRQIPKSDLIRI